MGPFFLVDLLGLDTVLHVAEHLQRVLRRLASTSTRACRSSSPTASSARRRGGAGFYENGEPQIEGDAEPDGEALAELMKLKAIVEACLVLEEGVCTVRDIDLGMMAGAGMDPRRGIFPPFMGADMLGPRRRPREARGGRGGARRALRAADACSSASSPRAASGPKTGQGFYAYPQPDEGEQTDTVKLETRGDVAIAWLANPPMNAISPQVIKDLGHGLGAGQGRRARSARW